jgi:hypothetical protein
MTEKDGRRREKRTFCSIVNNAAPENALRLMGRARIANRIAKSQRGKSRERAYAIKTQALLGLTSRFPEQVRIVNDFDTPRFVLVKASMCRFGLHAPAHLFGKAAQMPETAVAKVAGTVQGA